MIVKLAQDVPASPVDANGAQGVHIRLLIHRADGAPNFYMRQFTIAPGGCTPRHSHAWEHEVYVLRGQGAAVSADGETPLSPGRCVFVPGGEEHQFRNTGEGEMEFLCLVPKDSR